MIILYLRFCPISGLAHWIHFLAYLVIVSLKDFFLHKFFPVHFSVFSLSVQQGKFKWIAITNTMQGRKMKESFYLKYNKQACFCCKFAIKHWQSQMTCINDHHMCSDLMYVLFIHRSNIALHITKENDFMWMAARW